MARFLIPLGVFVALAIVLGVAIKHSPDKENIASPLIGKPTPQFALPDLSEPSKTITTNDLKGHWYVLNVWGTWCVTCRAEHPMLLEAARQGIVPIIGLNWRDDDDEADEQRHDRADHDGGRDRLALEERAVRPSVDDVERRLERAEERDRRPQ